MRKCEIATQVFDAVDAVPLRLIEGGPLTIRVTDLPALALVPWFCEGSVQWAVRITDPSRPLTKKALESVPGSYASVQAGRLLVGVPGDGLEPNTYTLAPLVAAIERAVVRGTILELAAANLGRVQRDWQVKAESLTTNGNQRYVGTVGPDGDWTLEHTAPALSRRELETALDCGRKFVALGPREVTSLSEAEAVLLHSMSSPQANINPMAVRQLLALRNLRFEKAGTPELHRRMGDFDRRLYGLALGFFRHRLAGTPFRWNEPGDTGYPEAYLQEVARAVVNPGD